MNALAAIDGLRDYQLDALQASRDAFARGVWSQVMVLPCGAGKTVVFSHLLQAYSDWLAQFPTTQQRVLILAHRDELLQQAAEKLARYNPELRIGIEAASRRAAPMDDVVVASVQTLARSNYARLRLLDPLQFRLVVVDEAHHTPAETYQEILRYFNLTPPKALWDVKKPDQVPGARTRVREWWQGAWPNRLLVGVTATAERGDAVGLEWTFRELVFERSLRWMIERGYLSPVAGYVVETGVSLDAVKQTAGDFNIGQLAQVVNTPARNQQAVRAWLEVARGRRTLAFTVDIQHAVDLARAFRAEGIAAESVSGNDSERAEKVAEFRRGDVEVLANCALLTEGADIPETSCILHCRPTKSAGLYMQMSGRGFRLADGKQDCLLLDVVDIARKHSLLTAGDLFGLPKRFNAKGQNLSEQAGLVEKARQDFPEAQFLEGLDPETLQAQIRKLDLWTVAESAVTIKYARLRWTEETPTRFVVALPRRSQTDGALQSGAFEVPTRVLVFQDLLGGWEAVVLWPDRAEPLGTLDDIGSALRRAERWVQQVRPDAWAMKLRDAAWRDRKASEKQLARLRQMKAPLTEPELVALTRGQASDLLDQAFRKRRGPQ